MSTPGDVVWSTSDAGGRKQRLWAPRRYAGAMVLKILGIVLVVWLAFVIIGVLVKALSWLLVVGLVLAGATLAVGYVRRKSIR